MRCPVCQTTNPDGSARCSDCGAALSSTDNDLTGLLPDLVAATFPSESSLSSDLRPGALFAGRYRIDRLLGMGGMGAVHQALDVELDLVVAIKTIRTDVRSAALDPQGLRFKQELLLAREISHRNILRIHHFGESGGIKYITMAFIDGRDLAAVLEEQRLSIDRVILLGAQIAAGLGAAHHAGIVHRDLKPQNVLVDAHDHVYLSDFGLAKSIDVTVANLTRTGDFIGTPRYAAPEQISGKELDRRTDIYALGLILYEMATGVVPFDGGSLLDTMLKRVQEVPPPALMVNPLIPGFLNRIIMRCLERDPEARYQNADDVAADLNAARAPVATLRSRIASVAGIGRRLRSGRWIVAAVLLLAAGFGGVELYRALRLRQASSAGSAAAVQRRRIAIVPFTSAGDAAVGYAAIGVSEALSSKLFQLNDVTLASSAAVQRASAKGSLDEIGRDVGATILISGTVQGTEQRLRVTASIHEVDKGRVWSKEFDGVAGDLLTLEDAVYSSLLPILGLHPSNAELSHTLTHPTENLDAYATYLKGRAAMRDEQDLKRVAMAIELYQQALKQDRSFALAYSGVADGALRMYRGTKDAKWAAEASSAAEQARALDDTLVEVHMVLGSVYQATGKTTEALIELRRAVEMAPNSDEAYRRLGRAYLATGRGADAIEAYKKAVAVNPYHWVNSDTLGAAYVQLANFDAAIRAFKQVIEVAPNNVNGYNDLGAAYLQVGRYSDAITTLKQALERQKIPNTYTNLAIAYAQAGRFDEATVAFEQAVALQPQSELFVGNLADGYRWAGQAEKAAATYDRAIALALTALQINPRDASTKGNLALYYGKKGEMERARKLMADARAIDAANVSLIYNEAVMFALSGDRERAFASLTAAVRAGYPISAAAGDPDLRALRQDPRFGQLATAPRRTSP